MGYDWDAYAKHWKDITAELKEAGVTAPYIQALFKKHGKADGFAVIIEDIALRIGRRRAGINVDTEHGKDRPSLIEDDPHGGLGGSWGHSL